MTPYPTQLDSDAVTTLIGILEGKPALAADVHALWDIAGYGLSLALPDTTVTLTHAQAAAHLRTAQANGILSGLPWGQILGIILQILQGIFNQPTGS